MKPQRRAASALGISQAVGLQPLSPGRATETLLAAITRVVLTAVTIWQAVMATVSLASSEAGSIPLAVVQVLIASLAVVSRHEKRCWPFLAVSMFLAGVCGYLVSGKIDSALSFAACWQINFASFVVGLLILRRYAVWLVMASAAAASTAILSFLPDWGVQLPLSVFVTQTTIVLAIRLGVAALLRSASSTDQAIRDADASALRRTSLAHIGARIAEESRVLHDTAINTFTAIAAGGAALRDHAQVREQCARDVALIDQLRGTQRAAPDVSIMEVFEQHRLPVRRAGVDDTHIERLDQALHTDVARAMVGCVREAANNASKYSGVEYIDIEVVADSNELVVKVSDDGVGFELSTVKKRGLTTSIERRAHESGIVAEVCSSPGMGTSVTLRTTLANVNSSKPTLVDDGALAGAAMTARRRAGLYWGIGVTAESIVLTLAGGTNEHLALLPMIMVMALSLAIAISPALRRASLASPILILATVFVFFFSAQATEFGAVGATHWQALAAAGPFVLLLSITDSRAWRAAGAVTWCVVILAIAARAALSSLTASAIVVVAGIVGLGFSLVWAQFQGIMQKLSTVAAEARRQEFEARLRSEQEAAAQASYQRWTAAGLDSASQLLREIRDGVLDPGAVDTRTACDEEERYLRQLVLISPELVHLGKSFMSLLSQARAAEVNLTLRLGNQDAGTSSSAASIADTISLNIRTAGRGGSLAATIFPVAEGLRLTLTGQTLRAPGNVAAKSRHLQLSRTELLEVDFDNVKAIERESPAVGDVATTDTETLHSRNQR